MGIFSKKPPCPICGGKISWFLPSKIEGQYICDTCFGKIDMEQEKANSLTMQSFREYLAFYEENRALKDRFQVSEQVDFGLWDTKIIFDYENRLFCMSKRPDKTVFEAKHLKSFTIKEDSTVLYEGSAAGIRRYASSVTDLARAMAPQIAQFLMTRQMAQALEHLDKDKKNEPVHVPNFDLPEPFRAFNVELRLDHPYWSVIRCDMDGPRFDNNRPDIDDYIRSYQLCLEEIQKLVAALRTVAFPGAAEQYIGPGSAAAVHTTVAPSVDAIEEIKKYKALMDEGVISRQEFDAKKKQLLGI